MHHFLNLKKKKKKHSLDPFLTQKPQNKIPPQKDHLISLNPLCILL